MKNWLLFCFLSLHAWAHPHTFIDVSLHIVGEKNAEKIEVTWLFDEMTSAALLEDFDANKNAQFEKDEVADFKKTVFDDLKKYEYYTHLKAGGKRVKTEPQALSLRQEGKHFALSFALDLRSLMHQKKSIGFWDEELFCALALEKEQIHTSLTYTLKEVDNAYYYGYLLEIL